MNFLRTFLFLFTCFLAFNCCADRIYIMNSSGYNQAGTELIAAITSNGHTVTNNTTSLSALPVGFTSTCVDPVNGYDWLCFFGSDNFSSLLTGIQDFIDDGGKVFYQYEVSCCVTSATSAASIVSGLTGLSVSPNSEPYISFGGGTPGWEAVGCCLTMVGSAYRCMDGIPPQNELLATGDIGSGTPTYTTCPNFGFAFSSVDFTSGQNKGGIVGFGDVNIWYDAGEPWANGGSGPVNMGVVDYIFPNNSSTCFIFPAGCTDQPITANTGLGGSVFLGNDMGLCPGETIILDGGSQNSGFLWQDNSSNQTFEVTVAGTYWVEVSGSCGSSSDTIEITNLAIPTVNLGPDLFLCIDSSLTVTADIENANSFIWQDNSGNSSFIVSQEGIYWIEATNDCGSARDSVEITAVNPPVVELGEDVLLCEGENIQLNASTPGGTYEWINGSSGPQITVSAPGQYWVEVTVNNCVGMDMIAITNELCLVILDMPNVFTPNADLSNEMFVPVNIEGIQEANIVILNRWGNIVYESDDILSGWNGKYNDEACSEGTYFWQVKYLDVYGKTEEVHGFVALER